MSPLQVKTAGFLPGGCLLANFARVVISMPVTLVFFALSAFVCLSGVLQFLLGVCCAQLHFLVEWQQAYTVCERLAVSARLSGHLWRFLGRT